MKKERFWEKNRRFYNMKLVFNTLLKEMGGCDVSEIRRIVWNINISPFLVENSHFTLNALKHLYFLTPTYVLDSKTDLFCIIVLR